MKQLKINTGKVKMAIICKDVNSTFLNREIKKTHIPKAGDVAVFKIKKIGKHTRIQTVGGNNKYILPGDLIMAAFGNRYATEQIEGYVPETYHSTYHILGQGGAVGILKSIHEKLELEGPTTIGLVGYIVNEKGLVVNTKYLKKDTFINYRHSITMKSTTILSLGTSMDSGKTTSAASLTRGLKNAGKKVAFIKLTGTVFTKDKSMVSDYGADITVDFSDFGFPSTYMCSTDEILVLFRRLLAKVNQINPDYIIVEIADGLLQKETNALIQCKWLNDKVAGVIFSSGDSMSAISGADMLSQLGYNILAVTGLFTRSPLLVEEVKAKSRYTVLVCENLMSKGIINYLEQKLNFRSFERKMALIS